MAGFRRHIPDPTTFNNLFRDWDDIIEEQFVATIPQDFAIPSGAVLARGDGTAEVFFIDTQVKRWVSAPQIMDAYHFDWNKVFVVPRILLDHILNGFPIL